MRKNMQNNKPDNAVQWFFASLCRYASYAGFYIHIGEERVCVVCGVLVGAVATLKVKGVARWYIFVAYITNALYIYIIGLKEREIQRNALDVVMWRYVRLCELPSAKKLNAI